MTHGIRMPSLPYELTGDIQFHDVTFQYPERPHVTVLNQFNLLVKADETLALVGRVMVCLFEV